jgi:hypothetical protein
MRNNSKVFDCKKRYEREREREGERERPEGEDRGKTLRGTRTRALSAKRRSSVSKYSRRKALQY